MTPTVILRVRLDWAGAAGGVDTDSNTESPGGLGRVIQRVRLDWAGSADGVDIDSNIESS